MKSRPIYFEGISSIGRISIKWSQFSTLLYFFFINFFLYFYIFHINFYLHFSKLFYTLYFSYQLLSILSKIILCFINYLSKIKLFTSFKEKKKSTSSYDNLKEHVVVFMQYMREDQEVRWRISKILEHHPDFDLIIDCHKIVEDKFEKQFTLVESESDLQSSSLWGWFLRNE